MCFNELDKSYAEFESVFSVIQIHLDQRFYRLVKTDLATTHQNQFDPFSKILCQLGCEDALLPLIFSSSFAMGNRTVDGEGFWGRLHGWLMMATL